MAEKYLKTDAFGASLVASDCMAFSIELHNLVRILRTCVLELLRG